MLPTIEHSVRCGLLMKARWDDEDDDDVMTRSQPQPPPGQPCHALLGLPAGVRRGDRVDFRWFDEGRSCGAEWRGGRCQTGGKAVIWCNELWLWLSVPAKLFPGEHLQHSQVTSDPITNPPSTTNNTNWSACVSVSVSVSYAQLLWQLTLYLL